MEHLTSETGELKKFLHCEIEIKNEPMELLEGSYCGEDSSGCSFEQRGIFLPRQEKEHLNTIELRPVTFVDVKPIINETIHDPESLDYFGRRGGRTRKMSPATKIRLKRARETKEQRSERLRKNRERVAQKRATERQRVELYQEQLKKRRERVAQKRSRMSPEQRLEMLKKNREYKRRKRLKQKLFNNMIESVRPNIHSRGSLSNNVFVCNVCNISFSDHRTFNEHYLSHYQKYNFFCEFCGKGFFYQYDLTEHKLSHINTSEPLKCDICSSLHVSHIDLLNHCKNVHSTRNFKIMCNICHKFFRDKKSLKNHNKLHCVEKKDSEFREKTKFLCEICGKIISSYQSFQNHYRIHTGEKPFMCKDCGKSFTAYVGLHFHSRIHTGQKPYKCEHCEKTFSQRSSYAVHVRLHTGEKPFPCKICDKSYVTSSLLKVHFRKVHENI